MKARHEELCTHLSGEHTNKLPQQELTALNVELGELTPAVEAYNALQRLLTEAKELEGMLNGEDDDMRKLAREEQQALEEQVPALEEALLTHLLPRDEADERGAVLEVRAGTGGDEAALFAGDLFRMYQRFAELRRWKFEVLEAAESDMGGYKLASANIGGRGAYGALKFESGIHRVQRVPVTESAGRVHTSAASVAVMPQAEEVDVSVRDEDLRIDTYRAGGAGGQHVNTTNSAVRITHIPSGLVVAIQDERSQHKNKAKALKILRARLFEAQRQRQRAEQSSERKGLIGSGDRSERIRTYNFPQGRVTDHRVGVTEHGIEGVLSGASLDVFTEALVTHHKQQLLSDL
ncbi:g1748 [Coccomyxa elongata]